jgi:outer membrane protein assembly factor BamB
MKEPSRRGFLAACGLAGVAGCTAPTTTDERATGTPTDTSSTATSTPRESIDLGDDPVWPTFGGNAANTGRRGDGSGPSAPTTPAWRTDVAGIYTMPGPVVADDITFVGSGESAYAVDALSGKRLWDVDMGSLTHYFSPSVGEGHVLFGAQSNIASGGDAGRLSSFAFDGTERWRRSLAVTSTPSVVGDTAFVGESTAERAQLRALSAADGGDRWVAPFEATSIRGAPAVVDGVVFATATKSSEAGVVAARAVEDGSEVWTRTVDAGIQAAPVVQDGAVYVQANDGRLLALDAGTGERLWTARLGQRGATPPALTDDRLIGLVENTLVAVDLGSGDRAWELDIGYTLINGVSVAGERVYVGGSRLTAVDVRTGESAWVQDVPGQGGGFGAPVVVGNTMFVGVCIKEEANDPYDDFLYAYL